MRELAARLLGIVTMALSKDAAVSLLHGLLVSLEKTDGKAARFEDAEGALSAVGYVLAQCLTGALSSTLLDCSRHTCMPVLFELTLPLFGSSLHFKSYQILMHVM